MSIERTHPQAERDEEETLHYRAIARRLTDMAMEMAEQVLQDAKADPTPDHTERFERASRTVRRALLIARELAKPLPQPRSAASPAPPPNPTATRERIIRVVEDAIDRRRRTHGVDVEPLEAELLDRLDRPDVKHGLANRPIDEIIADIARDLGVGSPLNETFHVWKRRTPEDVERLQARAAHGCELPFTTPGPTGHQSRPPATAKIPDD